MTALLITILLSLGIIEISSDFENSSEQQKVEYLEIIGDSIHE